MSCFEPLLVVLLAASPDAGEAAPVSALVEQLTRELNARSDAERRETEKQLEQLGKKAAPAEKPLIERLLKLSREKLPLEKQLPQLAAISLELLKVAKGDFDAERAALGA